jgi:hypothetical protein
MFVCCDCCVLSGRGLCDELITRPEESHRLCCVVVCHLETSRMWRSWPALGRSATANKKKLLLICQSQWPLACWDRGFESHRGHGCLSVVSGVCCHVEVCDGLITLQEESYRLWCVVVCDLETLWMRRCWPTGGCCAKKNELLIYGDIHY